MAINSTNTQDRENNKFVESLSRPGKPATEVHLDSPVEFDNADNSAVTTVTVTTSSTQLLASNASRKYVVIFNDSGANVYIKLGTAASTTSFTWRLSNNASLEIQAPVYNGAIHAIRSTGSGDVRITEVS